MKLARVLSVAALLAGCVGSSAPAAQFFDIVEHSRVGVVMIPTPVYYFRARDICPSHADKRNCFYVAEEIKRLGVRVREDLNYGEVETGSMAANVYALNSLVFGFQRDYKGIGR